MKKFEEKIKENMPTLVVFQHAGKHDSVKVKYLVKELNDQFGKEVAIERVDTTFNGNIKEHFKLQEYPTWILFRKGEELMRESGEKTIADLIDMVKRGL